MKYFFFTLFASISLTKAVSADPKPKLYVLAIGVNHYEDPLWKDLKFAESDTEQISDAMIKSSPYKVQIKKMSGKQATKKNIERYFSNLSAKANRHDILFVYLSGHGSLYKSEAGDLEKVFILAETKKTAVASTGLKHRDLISWVQSQKIKRKAIVFATCHSGVGKSVLTPQIANLLAQNKGDYHLAPLEKVSDGFVILSAASKSEAARESSKLKGDIYTHFLIQALNIYDRNSDGVVSLLEAHDYAKQKTYQYTGGRQRPTIVVEAVGEADFALRGQMERNPETAVLEAYDSEFNGLTLEVAGGEKGVLPMAFPVKDGQIIHLYSEEEKRIASYSLSAKKGEVLQLKELADPNPYAFGGDFVQRSFSDRRFEKLSANQQWTGQRLSFRIYRDYFLGGLFYDTPMTKKSDIGVGLSSNVDLYSYGLYFGSRYYFPGEWFVSGNFRFNQIKTVLTIKDLQTGREREIEDRSWIPGVQLQFGHSFLRGTTHLLFSYEMYQKHKYDFSELGSLESSNSTMSLGIEFSFGGKGRQL